MRGEITSESSGSSRRYVSLLNMNMILLDGNGFYIIKFFHHKLYPHRNCQSSPICENQSQDTPSIDLMFTAHPFSSSHTTLAEFSINLYPLDKKLEAHRIVHPPVSSLLLGVLRSLNIRWVSRFMPSC
ncbi:hypothetical protein QCA50_020315 [Cerrena zonata]|uniref:Maturase K n=1 Tax=Cerrena zonata TaxID=2478898 RepID=A0AAW0FC11_9APHY